MNNNFEKYSINDDYRDYMSTKNVYLIENKGTSIILHGEATTGDTNNVCSIDNFITPNNDKQTTRGSNLKDLIKKDDLHCYVHIDDSICINANKKHKYYIYQTKVFDNFNDNDNNLDNQIYWKNMMYYDLLKTDKKNHIKYSDFIAINPKPNTHEDNILYYIFKDKKVYSDLVNCKHTSDKQNIFTYLRTLSRDTSSNPYTTPSSDPYTTPYSNQHEQHLISINDFIDLINNTKLTELDILHNWNNQISSTSNIKVWGDNDISGIILQRNETYDFINPKSQPTTNTG